MEDEEDLTGQLARLPGGQKVIVDSQDGSPAWATARRIGGQHDGLRAVNLVSKPEPFDVNVPVDEETDWRGNYSLSEALNLPRPLHRSKYCTNHVLAACGFDNVIVSTRLECLVFGRLVPIAGINDYRSI